MTVASQAFLIHLKMPLIFVDALIKTEYNINDNCQKMEMEALGMQLSGWRYEGRKISDLLHEQILAIVEILNDPLKVGDRNWPQLQSYISCELGITNGQVRTIKRMMEELGMVKRGILNAHNIPNAEKIYTDNGQTFVELIAAEKLMRENSNNDNLETVEEIRKIYRLYYQKALAAYTYDLDGQILHPLRATLKAIKKYGYLDFWEWYLLNTIVQSDNNEDEEVELEENITLYRQGRINFKETDIKENQLSHSYVLGNYTYAGLVCVSGKKPDLKITINKDAGEIINVIIA